MAESSTTAADGSSDFSSGCNSICVPTVQSQITPNGLPRSALAWMNNCTVRDGGITQRYGFQPRGVIHNGSAIYQGGYMYQPDAANPYLILQIGGHVYRVNVETFGVTDLTPAAALQNPPTVEQAYFAQGEQFLVIQAGDGVTLPLFWDGAVLRRSSGLTGTPKELPAATCMDYYMGRMWYAQGRQYTAGDIVKGPAGTLPYQFRDAILKVTENPMALGGDGFVIPSNDGIIRALKHSANIDVALGQGRLFAFTRKGVYALQVPITRLNWIAADTSNQPLQTVVQLVNGSVNDRSVVAVNGDLFYQSLEPGIRSLMQSMRYFTQWGNIQISSNEQRILQFNDRALLHAASGIQFQDRMLQTALPRRTPQGIVHDALIPMDFIPISSFNKQKEPNWEGSYSGLSILQMFVGDFGGRERAFAVVVSGTGSIDLWELTAADLFENGDGRVQWYAETPAFTWGKEFDLKKLVALELSIDRLYGTVEFQVEWRPDGATCWNFWHAWKECSPRNSAEDPVNPITYPLTEYGQCYRSTMTLPRPPDKCAPCSTGRPANIGYQFQFRITIKGFCRIRSMLAHAEKVERQTYANITC